MLLIPIRCYSDCCESKSVFIFQEHFLSQLLKKTWYEAVLIWAMNKLCLKFSYPSYKRPETATTPCAITGFFCCRRHLANQSVSMSESQRLEGRHVLQLNRFLRELTTVVPIIGALTIKCFDVRVPAVQTCHHSKMV